MRESSRPARVFIGGPFSIGMSHARYEAPTDSGYRFNDDNLKALFTKVIETTKSTGASVLSAHLSDNWGERFDFGFCARDLKWSQACDVFLVLLPIQHNGSMYRTDGTFVEIGMALAAGKKVVLLSEDPPNEQWSFFIRDLVSSKKVSFQYISDFFERPKEILFDDILYGETRTYVTDVRLWRWLQNEADKITLVKVGKAMLEILPGVMNPKFSHCPDFIMSFWHIPKGSRVLDLGTGSGVLGVNACYEGAAEVVAVDINETAIETAKNNFIKNNFPDNSHVFLSDCYTNVTGKFDVIIFSPPYWDNASLGGVDDACFDERCAFSYRAIVEAKKHLNDGGRLFIGYADQGNMRRMSEIIQESGLEIVNCEIGRPSALGHHVRVGWELRKEII